MTGSASSPAVSLQDVSVTYETPAGDRVGALAGISWMLERGTSAAVVGRSGSGKSTLLSVLSLMRRPSSGRVEVLGLDVDALSQREAAQARATRIGVVFQSFHLDDRQPLWWNLSLPWVFAGGSSLRAARRRADELLETVGLDGMGRRRAADLSGGQRQRAAIARGLMTSPELFVADEPTGNLDENTANTVADLIFGLPERAGVSVVVVTHDHDIARRADQRVHLVKGVLTDSDPTLAPAG